MRIAFAQLFNALGNSSSSNQLKRIEKVLELFEDLWKAGARPSISAFLTDDENRADLLFELTHFDLSSRIKIGEDARVEEYLEQFPELIQDRTGVIELIVAEFRLRGQNGMHFKPELFATRFPSYADELAVLLDHQLCRQHRCRFDVDRSEGGVELG